MGQLSDKRGLFIRLFTGRIFFDNYSRALIDDIRFKKMFVYFLFNDTQYIQKELILLDAKRRNIYISTQNLYQNEIKNLVELLPGRCVNLPKRIHVSIFNFDFLFEFNIYIYFRSIHQINHFCRCTGELFFKQTFSQSLSCLI